MAFKVKSNKKKNEKIIYDEEYYLGKDPRKTKYYKDEMKRERTDGI